MHFSEGGLREEKVLLLIIPEPEGRAVLKRDRKLITASNMAVLPLKK